jgi:uncharacterized protein
VFTIISLIWLALGALPLIRAIRKQSPEEPAASQRRIIRGALYLAGAIALLVLISIFFSIYSELLWFRSLGFGDRYWLEISTKVFLFLGGAVLSFAVFLGFFKWAGKNSQNVLQRWAPYVGAAAGALILGGWASGWWELVLRFLYQAPSEVTDPIFGRSVGYYLFTLPLYQEIISWLLFFLLLLAGGSGLVLALGYGGLATGEQQFRRLIAQSGRLRRLLLTLLGMAFLVFAWSNYLKVFELMFSRGGIVTGPGWVDVNVRRIAYYVVAATYLAAAVAAFVSVARETVLYRLLALKKMEDSEVVQPTPKTAILPVSVVAIIFLATSVAPWVFQTLYVSPNEITLEQPYIAHNIEFTRRAFSINEETVEERDYSVGRRISQAVVDANEATLDNIRLWDPTALLSNLQEQQEIRLYYEFEDVDIDRYTIDGEYTQVMLSLRELEKASLPDQAQTWVSRHLKYTHGYGMVLLPVHDILAQGRPNLFIRGIPPETEYEELKISRPEIYYGERTTDHVYVKTSQQEFDYPSGSENVFTEYEGSGGIEMGGLLRRFIFASRFDGEKQLFSGYFQEGSRILFDRSIRERVVKGAPFLMFDEDPYPVLSEDGGIKFIVDAYTVTPDYPYSEAYDGRRDRYRGANYMRNSVKAVVDAYDGEVVYYVMDPSDIIINTYRRMFPALFRPFEEMPEYLKDHIRYPVDYLTVQAEMYQVYHMTDVAAFYQREDVWEFATERYREAAQPVEPYYALVNLPETDENEFVLLIPFTPRNKNVMNAWIAGRSDQPNYGKITVFTFPKGVEVLGPRQIEARIDQNSEMSQTLSLWDQEGSQVIRGNMLAIPLFDEDELYMLFVEPVILQAESAQLPEIKRVVLADQTQVVWAPEFQASLDALLSTGPAGREEAVVATAAAEGQPVVSSALRGQMQEAVDAFRSYKEELSAGNFSDAGQSLESLDTTMQAIGDSLGGGAE